MLEDNRSLTFGSTHVLCYNHHHLFSPWYIWLINAYSFTTVSVSTYRIMNQRCRNEPDSFKVDRKVVGKIFQNCQPKKQKARTKQTGNLGTLIIKQTLIPSDYFLFLPSMHDHKAYFFFLHLCVYNFVISKLNNKLSHKTGSYMI